MQASQEAIDLTMLLIASGVLVLVFWVAVTTSSRVMRFVLIGFVVIVIALMLWNLHIHGGMHAL